MFLFSSLKIYLIHDCILSKKSPLNMLTNFVLIKQASALPRYAWIKTNFTWIWTIIVMWGCLSLKTCHSTLEEFVLKSFCGIYSIKIVFLKISQNSPQITCAKVSFLMKLQALKPGLMTLVRPRDQSSCDFIGRSISSKWPSCQNW